jgi:hypothetical protein
VFFFLWQKSLAVDTGVSARTETIRESCDHRALLAVLARIEAAGACGRELAQSSQNGHSERVGGRTRASAGEVGQIDACASVLTRDRVAVLRSSLTPRVRVGRIAFAVEIHRSGI